jgi:hypothetical protein
MTLNLETELIEDPKFWKKFHKDIEKAKKDFIKSGKLGGNPLGLPNNTLKKDVIK